MSQLTVTAGKIWGEKNGAERSLKDQKIDNIEFRKNTMTKWKSNLKSIRVRTYVATKVKIRR